MEQNKKRYFLIVVALVCFGAGVLVSSILHKLTSNRLTTLGAAYGYNEKYDVWNRIRVDFQGNVICSYSKPDAVEAPITGGK